MESIKYKYILSIITVCKDSELTICDTVDTVINAIHHNKNIEYLIQDGESKDNTLNIIKKRIKNIQNIRLFCERDNGIYDAMNRAIDKCKGKYILFLNSDDILLSNFSNNKFIDLLNLDIDLIICPLIFFNRPSFKIKRLWFNTNKQRSFVNLFLSPYPPHPGFVCSSALIKKYLFNEKYGTAADYHLIQQILLNKNLLKKYYSKPIIAMSLGGASTRVKGVIKASKQINNIHRDLRIRGVPFVRYFRNISQYLSAIFYNKELYFDRVKDTGYTYNLNVKLRKKI